MSKEERQLDIIFWGGFPFSYGFGTQVNMATQLSKRHRVLYVDHPTALLRTLFYGTLREWSLNVMDRIVKRKIFEQKNKNLWIYHAFKLPVLPFAWPGSVHLFNMNLNRSILSSFLKNKKFTDIVFISTPPITGSVIKRLNPALSVYYCVDEYARISIMKKMPRMQKYVMTCEREILSAADCTIFTSTWLRDTKKEHTRTSFVLENCVDEEFIRQTGEIAPELSPFKRPVIGYAGGIHSRFDFASVTAAARHFPEYSFVLLGEGEGHAIPLDLPTNVHILGYRPYKEIPRYINGFDVCLIPFVRDPLSEAVFPLKIYEYFSRGKPVVATPVHSLVKSESLDHSLVYYYKTPEEIIAGITRALGETGDELKEARINEARKNTWQIRVRRLEEILTSQLYKK